jgi:hypothetical protein
MRRNKRDLVVPHPHRDCNVPLTCGKPAVRNSLAHLAETMLVLFLISGPVPLSSVRAAGGADSNSVKFEMYGELIFVPVQVNGAGPFRCIFDTGCNATQINEQRARELNVKLRGGTKNSIEIGGAKVENFHVDEYPFEELERHVGCRIDGIVGSDFFGRFVVEIDYSEHRLNLYDPNTYHYTGTEQPIPMRISRGFVFVSCDLQAGSEPAEGEFLLDSGGGGALDLNAPFCIANHLLEDVGKTISVRTFGGDGTKEDAIGRLRSFRIGRFALANPVVFLPVKAKGESRRSDYAGAVGGRILRRFKLTIDYAHERIFLDPNANLQEPFETDMSGLGLQVRGPDLSIIRVAEVRENSPAAEAGLRKGDELISIDGDPAASLGKPEIYRRFEREADFSLDVRRDDKPMKIVIHTRRLI